MSSKKTDMQTQTNRQGNGGNHSSSNGNSSPKTLPKQARFVKRPNDRNHTLKTGGKLPPDTK
jgi:hypothetical protein